MGERVYYLHVESGHFLVPAEFSVRGRAHLLSTPECELFYLPERDLEVSGNIHCLPATFKLEDLAKGKVEPTVQLTKETLKGPTSYWQIYRFTKIPSKAVLLEIEKEKIDRVMNAYRECKKTDEEFGKEFERYRKKHPNLPESFDYVPGVNPFEYYDRLYLVCEEVFIPLIKNFINNQDHPNVGG